jgi:phage anti-repressor protein
MNNQELIKITNQNGIETVNARELHSFLESKRQYANWIKQKIKKYSFAENADYIRFNNFVKGDLNTGYGNKTTTEYHISIDMAKELSMVENNDKGKQARQYFIECEKRLKENKTDSRYDKLTGIIETMLEMIKDDRKRIEKLETDFKALPKPTTQNINPQEDYNRYQHLVVSKIAKYFTTKPKHINHILYELGYQYLYNHTYKATDKGVKHSIVVSGIYGDCLAWDKVVRQIIKEYIIDNEVKLF